MFIGEGIFPAAANYFSRSPIVYPPCLQGKEKGKERNGSLMEIEPKEKLDPRALKAWFFSGLLWGLLLMIVPVAYFILNNLFWNLPLFYGWLGAGAVVLFILWEAVIIPKLKLHFWRYEIREEEIDIRHGVFIIRRTLIPMVRVQHVDTEHGPVMRLFNLATLRISTAATNHRIPALSREKAAELRGEISALARVSDEDV